MKTYFVKYWRNDGEWHSVGYDLAPTFVFEAREDGEAGKLALGYIIISKKEGEDFWISKLFEFNCKEVKIRDKFSDSNSAAQLEEKLRAANFMPFNEGF